MKQYSENNNFENWDSDSRSWDTSNDNSEVTSTIQARTIHDQLIDIMNGAIDNAYVMDELKELYALARHKEDKIKISKVGLHFFRNLIRQYELTGDDKNEMPPFQYGRIYSISQNLSFWEKEQETFIEPSNFTPVKMC